MTDPAPPQATLLLTGATGRVGRLICAQGRLAPAPGLALLAQHRDPARQDGLFWPLLDGPQPLLRHVARAGAPTAMIVLSGVTPAAGADLSLNTCLALAAVEAAQAAGIGRVLVASSSAVYGAGQGQAMDEASPLAPVNPYGQAKAAMEAALAPYRGKGVEICLLRIGNVAGADALLLNVAAANGQPVVIDRFADGHGPLRSYIGAGALWQVLAGLAGHRAPLPPALNIAAPRPLRMEALAQAAGSAFHWRDAPPTAHQSITLDCSRLMQLCPLDPAASRAETMVADWNKSRIP
jgi:UDP-glucose 4-epimerase